MKPHSALSPEDAYVRILDDVVPEPLSAKPGCSTLFVERGERDRTVRFFGLPGNPVFILAKFEKLTRSLLWALVEATLFFRVDRGVCAFDAGDMLYVRFFR